MYSPNRDFPLQSSHSTLPTPPVIPQGQTATTAWDRDAKSYRSLGARTPSPTPSEAAELSRVGAFDWQRLAQWRFWFRREWFCQSSASWFRKYTDTIPLGYYVALVLVCTVTTLVTLYHQEIVDFLRPAADWMHEYVYWPSVLSLVHDLPAFPLDLSSPSPYYSSYRSLRFAHSLCFPRCAAILTRLIVIWSRNRCHLMRAGVGVMAGLWYRMCWYIPWRSRKLLVCGIPPVVSAANRSCQRLQILLSLSWPKTGKDEHHIRLSGKSGS